MVDQTQIHKKFVQAMYIHEHKWLVCIHMPRVSNMPENGALQRCMCCYSWECSEPARQCGQKLLLSSLGESLPYAFLQRKFSLMCITAMYCTTAVLNAYISMNTSVPSVFYSHDTCTLCTNEQHMLITKLDWNVAMWMHPFALIRISSNPDWIQIRSRCTMKTASVMG